MALLVQKEVADRIIARNGKESILSLSVKAYGVPKIIAKVSRDAEIEQLKAHVGMDFGSGYMADPRTKAFVEKCWDKHPEIFRHSWAPYKKLVQEIAGKQQRLGEY